ncbi:hypothetical protein DEJ44_18815 [Streptomyces venezuelae]|uniref:Uncharacterized protein n=1 Tax=Streptomyces showdoensis TaxID=68268 RepID=A0A2P2GMP9_STREW|nr:MULTISPECIES: hypothetical protein [Streptomyces]KKZ72774.1 hypothetical protein VO63_16710 [Streptomyces showdoensis]QES07444.1 hypothetical protein DEJ44_18815 [Streptomyces venezuelae]
MMPGSLALRSVSRPVGSHVDTFGDADPNEPVRISVPITAHVSFAELLTLLVTTPGVCLTYADLVRDDVVRDSVRFALISTDLLSLDQRSEHVMAVYQGKVPGSRALSFEYLQSLGSAITRAFGLEAAL